MVEYFKSIYFNQIVVCLFFTRPEKSDTKKKQIKEAAKQNKKQRNCYYIIIPVYSHQSHPGPKQLFVYKITAEINCDLLQAGG